MNTIQKLQQSIYAEYSESVKLDPSAMYLHGTPLKPVVPLDTGTGGLFILGAYPSARFALINRVSDLPISDNLGPFESERWFDGSQVRQQPSVRELEDLFLSPIGVARSKCWITDLVKVFLFKSSHVQRYESLSAKTPSRPGYTRERFFELGLASLPWPWIEFEVGWLGWGRTIIGWGRTKLTSCFQREKLEKTSLLGPYFNVFGRKKGK